MALLEMSLKDSDKKMSISDKRQDVKLYCITQIENILFLSINRKDN